jgi:hypothetical protein
VERTDVLLCGGGWALRDSELGARERMPRVMELELHNFSTTTID